MKLGWAFLGWCLTVALCAYLQGCSGAAFETPPPPEAPNWEVTTFRTQYPDTPPGCVTVWTEDDTACRVAADSELEPLQCASGADVRLLRPRGMATDVPCRYGRNLGCDCANQVASPAP